MVRVCVSVVFSIGVHSFLAVESRQGPAGPFAGDTLPVYLLSTRSILIADVTVSSETEASDQFRGIDVSGEAAVPHLETRRDLVRRGCFRKKAKI